MSTSNPALPSGRTVFNAEVPREWIRKVMNRGFVKETAYHEHPADTMALAVKEGDVLLMLKRFASVAESAVPVVGCLNGLGVKGETGDEITDAITVAGVANAGFADFTENRRPTKVAYTISGVCTVVNTGNARFEVGDLVEVYAPDPTELKTPGFGESTRIAPRLRPLRPKETAGLGIVATMQEIRRDVEQRPSPSPYVNTARKALASLRTVAMIGASMTMSEEGKRMCLRYEQARPDGQKARILTAYFDPLGAGSARQPREADFLRELNARIVGPFSRNENLLFAPKEVTNGRKRKYEDTVTSDLVESQISAVPRLTAASTVVSSRIRRRILGVALSRAGPGESMDVSVSCAC
jgi:hypothetical protein